MNGPQAGIINCRTSRAADCACGAILARVGTRRYKSRAMLRVLAAQELL